MSTPPSPYGQYPAPYGNLPGGPQYYGPPPDNYLVWAILATVLCCVPLGVASIVFSSQVNTKWAMGDVQGALDSANKAKQFALWSAIATAGFWVLYLVFWLVVLGGLAALS